MTSTAPDLQEMDVRLRRPREDDIDARFALGANVDIAVMFGVSRDDDVRLRDLPPRNGFRISISIRMPG